MVRSRAAVVEAARTLFLEKGYDGTTVEEIASLAGVARRTVYNNYTDKEALFLEIVSEVIGDAEAFARGLDEEVGGAVAADDLRTVLHELGHRLALAILRPEVIALRRLLIGEARAFPDLAHEYFERAPGTVMAALASRFERWAGDGLLRAEDQGRAAEHFAYLVAGAPLDRAVLTGTVPDRDELVTTAREGVETFLARYGAAGAAGARRR